MFNSKIISVVRSFSKDEIKEFRKFVDSPFFNKEGKYVLRFYDEIKKYYPGFDNKSLERSILFYKLYPGKKYDDSIMRKLSSTLQKLAEEYLNLLTMKLESYSLHNYKNLPQIKNLSTETLEWGLSDDAINPTHPLISLSPNSVSTYQSSSLAPSGDFLLVKNEGAANATVELTIIE